MASELAQPYVPSGFLKLDRPNPFGANLGSLFHSYTWLFLLQDIAKLTVDLVKVVYRFTFATVVAP